MKPLLELGGKFVELVVAVDLNGLAGGIENDLAVFAGVGVGADLLEQIGADVAVEVIGKFAEEIGAGHAV